MTTILCPTRGGEASVKNQHKAIEVARERGWDLLFLYVSNVEFSLSFVGPVHTNVIQRDLDNLGQFLLAIAQERAEAEGVTAGAVVKHGSFNAALEEAVEECGDVNTVFLGNSADEKGITTSEYIRKLSKHLNDTLGLEVFVVQNGEVVECLQKK